MDEALRDLIVGVVNSRAKLDIIAFCQGNPSVAETPEGLAGRLGRTATVVAGALADLVDAGVLARRPHAGGPGRETYSLDSGGPVTQAVVGLVAACGGPERDDILRAVNQVDADQRQSHAAELQHIDDLKTRFVSMVSHELRTPVTIIKGTLTALMSQHEMETDRQQELLRVANRRCGELILLIENLLTMSGIQGGERLQLQLGRVSLTQLARQTVGQFDLEHPTHQFSVRVADTVPLVVADERYVQQVLVDLVDNAVKFSPGGGAVWLSAQQAGGDVVVTVEDEGIGLSPAEYDRVFDRFYQAEPHTTRVANGCGLGLYLARRVVAEHGGRIWVEGKDGPGLRVKFALPVAGPPQEAAGGTGGTAEDTEGTA